CWWLVLLWLSTITGTAQYREVGPGASIDPKPFRYSRKIPEAPAGLTTLVLDAGVIAHSRRDLADVRIADADHRQVPYLLEKSQDVLALELTLIPEKAASGRESQY